MNKNTQALLIFGKELIKKKAHQKNPTKTNQQPHQKKTPKPTTASVSTNKPHRKNICHCQAPSFGFLAPRTHFRGIFL